MMRCPCWGSGYAGERVATASPIRIEIVRKRKGQIGFAVHARRVSVALRQGQRIVLHGPAGANVS